MPGSSNRMLLLFRLVLAFSLFFYLGYGDTSTVADVSNSLTTVHSDTSSTMLKQASNSTNSTETNTATTTEGPKSTGLTSIISSVGSLTTSLGHTVNSSSTQNVTTTYSLTTASNQTATNITVNAFTVTANNITANNLTTQPPSATHGNTTITNLNWTTTSVNISVTPTSSNVTKTLITTTPGGTNQSTTTPTNTSSATTTVNNPLTPTNASCAGISGNSKDTADSAGVVLGAIIGSILGISLISLAVYFLCGSKKSSSFSHRRLYEETRNEPVLRLDNPANPYDVSYGDSSYYNPAALDEFSINNNHPREVIVMDDMSPRQPSA
ncbi:hypothetical protein XENTR_v10011020 [Xenopus tropicalis]|uniref:Mucin 15, cell surface associated n=1 Tax=Xenopus tropicalis TaxID=8364 RepID=A0A6I8R3H8_XENTR|nr:hypothetical protein XENTR_v10011020 [Xenopus tropicalis]